MWGILGNSQMVTNEGVHHENVTKPWLLQYNWANEAEITNQKKMLQDEAKSRQVLRMREQLCTEFPDVGSTTHLLKNYENIESHFCQ